MMTDWHVRVDYPCPGIVDQDEAAERLALRLAAAAGNAVVAIDRRRGRAVIRLTVQAGSVRQAVDQGVREAERIATAAELTRRAVRAEAITDAEDEDELRQPNLPELVGAREAAEILDVSRQRISQLAAGHATFPAPVASLASGPVWTAESIRAFGERWERRRTGRPPKKSREECPN